MFISTSYVLSSFPYKFLHKFLFIHNVSFSEFFFAMRTAVDFKYSLSTSHHSH